MIHLGTHHDAETLPYVMREIDARFSFRTLARIPHKGEGVDIMANIATLDPDVTRNAYNYIKGFNAAIKHRKFMES